jgi:hypothetical protein
VKGLRDVHFAGGDEGCVTLELAEGDDVAAALDASVPDMAKAVRGAVMAAEVTALAEAVTAAFPELDADKLAQAITDGITKALGAEADASPAIEAVLKEWFGKLVAALPTKAPAAADTNLAEGGAKSARELELDAREADINSRAKKQRRDGHVSFLEALNRQGKRLPCSRDVALELFELCETSEVTFSEGDKKTAPLDVLKSIVQLVPKTVELGEHGATGEGEFAEDDAQAVADAASAYLAEQHAKGNMITTSQAVNHVKGKR